MIVWSGVLLFELGRRMRKPRRAADTIAGTHDGNRRFLTSNSSTSTLAANHTGWAASHNCFPVAVSASGLLLPSAFSRNFQPIQQKGSRAGFELRRLVEVLNAGDLGACRGFCMAYDLSNANCDAVMPSGRSFSS